MRVRCVRIVGSDGRPQDKSSWLTIGKIYDVLEILLIDDRGWQLRLVGDGANGVALFQLDMFDIVDPQVRLNWIATWGDGIFCLGPEPWSRAGFWQQYYDGDPSAVQVFEEERRKAVDSL